MLPVTTRVLLQFTLPQERPEWRWGESGRVLLCRAGHGLSVWRQRGGVARRWRQRAGPAQLMLALAVHLLLHLLTVACMAWLVMGTKLVGSCWARLGMG